MTSNDRTCAACGETIGVHELLTAAYGDGSHPEASWLTLPGDRRPRCVWHSGCRHSAAERR